MLSHKVHLDKTSSGHHRYTCHSERCAEATIVRQPFMNEERWKADSEAFLKKHPCSKVMSEIAKEHLIAQH